MWLRSCKLAESQVPDLGEHFRLPRAYWDQVKIQLEAQLFENLGDKLKDCLWGWRAVECGVGLNRPGLVSFLECSPKGQKYHCNRLLGRKKDLHWEMDWVFTYFRVLNRENGWYGV